MFSYGEDETEEPQPAYVISLGGTAGEIVDESRVLLDYPTYNGRSQIGSLRIDSDREVEDFASGLLIPIPDGREIDRNKDLPGSIHKFKRNDTTYVYSITGTEDLVPQGYLAAVMNYGRIDSRIDADIRNLAATFPHPGGPLGLNVFVVAWLGRGTGAGSLLVVLSVLQSLRLSLRDDAVAVERFALLTLPSVHDDQNEHVERWTHAAAVLASLSAAQQHGLLVAPDQTLEGPVAEWILLHGQPPVAPPDLKAQTMDAAATLRVLCDPGPLGNEIRTELRNMGVPQAAADPPEVFKSMGVSTLVFEHAAACQLLADLLLHQADEIASSKGLGGF